MYYEKYLKYKNKYLSLKKQQGGDYSITLPESCLKLETTFKASDNPLQITIGNYSFELIMYYPYSYSRRGLVYIKSIHIDSRNEKTFYVYSSLSECRFWRLCTADGGMLYKGNYTIDGYDYVQQTMINIKLQKFINNNVNKIPKKNNTDEIKTDICPQLYNYKKGTKIKTNEGNEINKRSRIIKIQPFYDYYKNGFKCGETHNNPEEKLKELSENIYKKFPILSKPILIYEKFYKELPLETLAQTHKQHFSKTPLIKDTTITTFIEGNIYKINMSNKDESIILYYLKYEMSIVNKEVSLLHVRNKYAPIILLKNDDDMEINEFGLYSNYIPAGNYICKILDYTDQCTSRYKPCSRSYSYIGYIYDNLYPYSVIRNQSL